MIYVSQSHFIPMVQDEYQLGERLPFQREPITFLKKLPRKVITSWTCLGLSDQAYHITSMVWNGETFLQMKKDKSAAMHLLLERRLLKDEEVHIKGEGTLKRTLIIMSFHTVYTGGRI